tara:strand:- start:58 stop:378 length:321 start_codon:yes stop_codon:yes gene_type:complete
MTIKSKLSNSKEEILRTVGLFILLRSIHGISILAIAYLLGWNLQDFREFKIFGFKIYLLVMVIVVTVVLRRFYKIYKWWKRLPETNNIPNGNAEVPSSNTGWHSDN